MFTWQGTNKKGQNIKGEMMSTSADLVKAELRKQGIVPKNGKVKKKSGGLFAPREKAITTKDIAVFSRQLATMMKAGVPMVQAFDIVGQGHSNPSMTKLIMNIKADIEAGGTLATATEQLRNKIKKAMTYPIIVLVVAVVVSAILLIFVVPTFAAMFADFGAELPAFTLFVVGLSDVLVENVWYFIGAIVAVVYTFKQAKIRSQAFRDFLDRAVLKLPGFGALTENSCIARFSRTLSTMFSAGVPLVEAMVSVAGATGNVVYNKAILQVRDDIASGTTLQVSLSQNKDVFPNMLIQMVGIGEESGALDDMLDKVADYYEEAVDDAVDNLTAMMEPAIMAFLAVLIGGLVIAMYLPIFKMGEVV